MRKYNEQKYIKLSDEREAVIDEINNWKQGCSYFYGNQKMGLWNNSTYLDELLYILIKIEKEIITYQI